MLINYSPIMTDATKSTFYDYINCLAIPQIDYFAIGIQHLASKKSMSLMSNPDWQKLFNENRFANYDPIRKATFLTRRNILPFTEIDYVDSLGKEIMRQRKLHGIANGVVLMERYEKYNYMITLGTSFSRFSAYSFLKNYHDKIVFLKKDLIKIIEDNVKEFLLVTEFTHLSIGAK